MDDKEEMYLRACHYVEEYRDASCAGLQRHLRIGYRAALQLQEQLAAAGAYKGISTVAEPQQWSIKVIGIGGAGCNALAALPDRLPTQIETLTLNRECAGALRRKRTKTLALASANSTAEGIAAIEAALTGVDLVFIAAGLSGTTGAGLAPVVAQAARRMGAVTIVTAYMPAAYEGADRTARAAAALDILARDCDAVLVTSLECRDREEEHCSLVDLLDRRDREFAALVLTLSQMLTDETALRPSINELLHVLDGRIWISSARADGPAAVDDALRAASAQLIGIGAPVPLDGLVAVLRVPPSTRFVKTARLGQCTSTVTGPQTRTSVAYHLDANLETVVEVTLLAAQRDSICRASE